MKGRMRGKLVAIGMVVLMAVSVLWMVFDGVEAIEDTNGPDDFSLAVITDEEIIDRISDSVGFGWTKNPVNGTVKFHSRNFSGIQEILRQDILFSTGVTLDVIDLEVNAGNFRMAVFHEDEIIMDITPETEFPLDLGALEGSVRLVIAGESADFSFRMWQSDVKLD